MTALPPSAGGVTPPPVLTHPADLRVTALLLSVHRSAAESERGLAPFVPSEHVHPLHRTPRLNGARSDFTTHGVRARSPYGGYSPHQLGQLAHALQVDTQGIEGWPRAQ